MEQISADKPRVNPTDFEGGVCLENWKLCPPRGMVGLCLTSLLKLQHPGLAANWYWKGEVFGRVSKDSCWGRYALARRVHAQALKTRQRERARDGVGPEAELMWDTPTGLFAILAIFAWF